MEANSTANPKPRRRTPWIAIAALPVIVVAIIPFIVLARRQPFARRSVIDALQQASGSTVEIKVFHSTYFPQPRCVAEGVSLLPGDSGGDPRPVITIQRLTVQSNFIALFTRRIELIRADGLYV